MLKLQHLTQRKGRIKRGPYALWGLLLFFLKHNLDRLYAYNFGKDWFFTDYFVQIDQLGILELAAADKEFYLRLLLFSLPFIYLGSLLTLKRLRDTGLHKGLLTFFFLPFINLMFFLILSMLPSKESVPASDKSFGRFMDRVIPRGWWSSAAFAIALLSLFAFPGMIFSVYVLGEYGWGLFVGIPFFMGMGSVLIYSHHEFRTLKQCMGIASSSLMIFGVLLILFASSFGRVEPL